MITLSPNLLNFTLETVVAIVTTDYFNDLFCTENITMKGIPSRKKNKDPILRYWHFLTIRFTYQFLHVNENCFYNPWFLEFK